MDFFNGIPDAIHTPLGILLAGVILFHYKRLIKKRKKPPRHTPYSGDPKIGYNRVKDAKGKPRLIKLLKKLIGRVLSSFKQNNGKGWSVSTQLRSLF